MYEDTAPYAKEATYATVVDVVFPSARRLRASRSRQAWEKEWRQTLTFTRCFSVDARATQILSRKAFHLSDILPSPC